MQSPDQDHRYAFLSFMHGHFFLTLRIGLSPCFLMGWIV